MPKYINMKAYGTIETIDEFETYREAKKMMEEYRLTHTDGLLYISNRPTNSWANSKQTAVRRMLDTICFNKRTNAEEILPFSSPKLLAKCRVPIGTFNKKSGVKHYWVKRADKWEQLIIND